MQARDGDSGLNGERFRGQGRHSSRTCVVIVVGARRNLEIRDYRQHVGHFVFDPLTGVISVVRRIDRESLSNPLAPCIALVIQAIIKTSYD